MDLYFGILVISILFGVLGMVVSGRLKRKFAYYSQVGIRSGMTGAQIAQKMLDDHGIHDVTIESVQGKLTDHYNPSTRQLTSVRRFIKGAVSLQLRLRLTRSAMLFSTLSPMLGCKCDLLLSLLFSLALT